MRTLLSFLVLLIAPANAQIYADFTVSSGGNPLGTFTVTLEHEKAPRTCANFIGLATGKRPWIDLTNGAVRKNTPYYDGLTFHRLIHSFVIQGGSRNGQGTDGPGYVIQDEYHPDLNHSAQYVISMAKSGVPNSGGSQFFITLRATPELDDKHSVFGSVTAGLDIVNGFKNPAGFPTDSGDKPATPIIIDSVTVYGPDAASFDINAPGLRLPHVSGTDMEISRDATAQTMTATFDRKPKTNYFFLQSPDLDIWAASKQIFSIDGATRQTHTLDSRPEDRYFLNLATVGYRDVPNAPGDVSSGTKTVRIKFSNGAFLDISPDGSGGGTWVDSTSNGTLVSTTWADEMPETGTAEGTFPQTHRLPLGIFTTILRNYPTTGSNVTLRTWLSFHTENTGWTEEVGSGQANRFAFELLSN